MSAGSGNFVGWLPLSENPSTDIAAAVTLDLTMISRKSQSARYAVCGSDFTGCGQRTAYSYHSLICQKKTS